MSRVRTWLAERFSSQRRPVEPRRAIEPRGTDRLTLLCDKVSLHSYLLKEETIRASSAKLGGDRILLQFALLRCSVQDFLEEMEKERCERAPPDYSEFELLPL